MKFDDDSVMSEADIVKNRESISVSHNEKIYTDEPIKPRNSSFPQKNSITSKIEAMLAYTPDDEALKGNAKYIFYQQAVMMQDYEEDYDYSRFVKRFMIHEGFQTYKSLTAEQLKAYFSWRKDMRNGKYPPLAMAFLRIYLNEIINLVGVSSIHNGYEIMRDIDKHYYSEKKDGSYFIKSLITEYIVYYGLDCSLIPVMSYDKSSDMLKKLINCSESSDEEILDTLSAFSEYKVRDSKFFIENSEITTKVIAETVRQLTVLCDENKGKTFIESLFGEMESYTHFPFFNNVLYVQEPKRNYEYSNGGAEIYKCVNGNWTVHTYHNTYCNKKVKAFVRTVERILREKTGYKYKLKAEKTEKLTEKKIEEIIADFLEKKAAAEAPKVEIDLSKIDSIRAVSELTRDKLIVEDEEEKEIQPESLPEPEIEYVKNELNDTPLSVSEYDFLHTLLYGDVSGQNGSMISVLADSVNEKLFDSFSDNVIEFEWDSPVIVEDYLDELKGMIKK